MTSRERVLKAMQLEHPDRVPLMCQFSIGFINQQLKRTGITPMEFWMDPHKYVEGLLMLRSQFQFDGILVSVHGHFENWRDGLMSLDTVNGVEVAQYADRTETYPHDDLASADFFNIKTQQIDEINVNELPEEIGYIPASKDCYAFIDWNNPFLVFDLLNEKTKGKYSIHGEIISPFDYLLYLLGYEQALLALLFQPEKCKMILQIFTTGLIRLLEGMCAKNIDAVKISSPFTGMGFISPEQYLEFEQPYLMQLAATISGFGKYSYIHTCGHIHDRLEYMRDTGTNGLECLDPPPIGNVNLEDAFKRVGKDLFIKGNIDPVNTLFKGTNEIISKDVAERIKIGKQNPGFILSSACSIAPMTPPENIKKLHEIVEEYGYY